VRRNRLRDRGRRRDGGGMAARRSGARRSTRGGDRRVRPRSRRATRYERLRPRASPRAASPRASRRRGAGARGPGRSAWHRDRYDELARRDADGFAELARVRLRGDGELPEKVALLQVARRRDPPLADELWTGALDLARTGDAALRDAALLLLLVDAPTSAEACRRLLTCAVLERQLDAELRGRAARALAENADEALLADAAPLLRDEPDATVRADLLRGLLCNPSPAAAALAGEFWRDSR
jgi:hypothetical protein